MPFKDYYGNPLDFPIHIHTVSDTQRDGSTAIATNTKDGFMSNLDKINVNDIEQSLVVLEDKIKEGVFIKVKAGTLLVGSSFNTALKELSTTATSLIFTEEPIPDDKIATAKVASDPTSEYKLYMWLDDDTTIKVAPEEVNVTIFTNINSNNMFEDCTSFTSMDLRYLNTSNTVHMSYMFASCTGLTSLDVSNFDTSNVKFMYRIFYNCSKLTSLDLSNFNTSKVVEMQYMFAYCTNLVSLNVSSFDTSNVTNMTFMFSRLNKLSSLYVLNFDTSKVTNMTQMFMQCYALTTLDLSSFRTPVLTQASGMFSACSNLVSLDVSGFDVSKISSMYGMFDDCPKLINLDLSNFITTSMNTLNGMFENDTNLPLLDLSGFNTDNVTAMNRTFSGCTKLTASITIGTPELIDGYTDVFLNCSTEPGSKFIVNYKAGCKTVAEAMVATKSANSNVVLGVEVA